MAEFHPVYKVPLSTQLRRSSLRPIFRLIFHLLARVTITGRENVPPRGAYLITINHVSTYDPPFALAFWPTAPEAVGAVDIWRRPGQRQLAIWYGGIPVHRGEFDRSLLDKMTSILLSGRPIIIAPEGERSHVPGMQRGFPGVAYVMDRTGVPVIPVGIIGTTDDFMERALHFTRPHLEMHIGKPFHLPPISGSGHVRQESRQHNADLIMEAIAELLPEEYRGVYSSNPYGSQ